MGLQVWFYLCHSPLAFEQRVVLSVPNCILGLPSQPLLILKSTRLSLFCSLLETSYFQGPTTGHLGEGRDSAELQVLFLSAEWEGQTSVLPLQER